MKKRIAFLIALLMILCLALSGCGQRDNNPGAIKTDTEPGGNSANTDPVKEPDDTVDVNGGSGSYSFEVNGVKLTLNTDVKKYIKGDVFYYTDLAYDLGWHAKSPEFKERADVSQFFADDDNKLYVGFTDPNTYDFRGITFVLGIAGEGHVNISFDRNDLYGDVKTYYVNPDGKYTVNMSQITLMTYLLENHIKNDFEDPFEYVLMRGGDAYYHVYE